MRSQGRLSSVGGAGLLAGAIPAAFFVGLALLSWRERGRFNH